MFQNTKMGKTQRCVRMFCIHIELEVTLNPALIYEGDSKQYMSISGVLAGCVIAITPAIANYEQAEPCFTLDVTWLD